ncbi:MAG: hypothetical protein IPH24_11445 [Crocinitomicaceae bacterium]|nr:hypothetical protein [Crocinitomicaceae bacterium]
MKFFFALLFSLVAFSSLAQYGFPSMVESQMLGSEDYYYQKISVKRTAAKAQCAIA